MPWIENLTTAWRGHRAFAEWLVATTRPSVIVDIGVAYGYSTMCFATAAKKWAPTTKVYGIDTFKGDSMSGFADTKASVDALIVEHDLSSNVKLIQSDFDTAAATWSEPIDILHIDGFHTEEAAQNDFSKWSPFVAEHGIIIMHDVFVKHFGVHKVFNAIEGFDKLHFEECYGLGVLTKNEQLHASILKSWRSIKRGNVKF